MPKEQWTKRILLLRTPRYEVEPLVEVDHEITEIQESLKGLQQRLETLTGGKAKQSADSQAVTTEESPTDKVGTNQPSPAAAGTGTDSANTSGNDSRAMDASPPAGTTATSQQMMATLRAGMAELAAAKEIKEVPRFFARLAGRMGLRMLLLKRWRSGMQVIHTEGITMPSEATKKRSDGRAPIPIQDDDIFAAISEERTVYAGPVPVKNFPLDLTLLLGRGSRDRQVVLLPIPARDHWNSFMYLDADHGNEKALAVAEVLAQFALARMSLLHKGEAVHGMKTAGILKKELKRRQESLARRAEAAELSKEDVGTEEESDPDLSSTDTRLSAELPRTDASPQARAWTPEAILQHSGELPALPRAASHILAVIENPQTTATKLEKAIALDQALTAKVLRIANSPFYGAVRDIKTVSEAVVRLGFVAIRNWTLVAATKSVFLTPGAGMLFQKIWRQSVLSAMASQLVAQAMRDREPESVFLGGLMQNIGQLVIARAEPELFHEIVDASATRQVPYYVVEKEILGFDHGELGALLIQEWNLSRELEEAVRYHHRLGEVEADNRLPGMIALGEEIAACSSSTPDEDAANWENSEPSRVLDVSQEQYAELQEQARLLSIDPQFFN